VSKLARKKIYIPELLFVETNSFANGLVCWISGPYYTIKQRYYPMFSISLQKEQLLCSSISTTTVSNFFNISKKIYSKQNNKQLSLLYSQTRQVLISASVGFKNFLKIRGVGYKFNVFPTYLTIEVGYSHLLKKKFPLFKSFMANKKTTTLRAQAPNLVILNTFFAATRSLRQPDVYKGKGIRYKKDFSYRKEGKKKKTT
jgi:large subunit ribosomal protein L6